MKTIELLMEDNPFEGLDAIALVKSPAIEEGFFAFNKHQKEYTLADIERLVLNEVLKDIVPKYEFKEELKREQMLATPLMIPNKLIPRIDEKTGEEYQVFFSEDTIKKLSYSFLKNKLQDSFNLEHDSNKELSNITLVESWLVDEKEDKSFKYGFSLPKGTWFGLIHIEDKRIWDAYVETGMVAGVSVEGMFSEKLLSLSNISEK